MCGLYGWNFNGHKGISAARRDVMAGVLAIENTKRGDDSHGAYVLAAQGKEPKIIRAVGPASESGEVSRWGRFAVVMAHTRQATHGAVTVQNQHPFRHGTVTLAHNGVIANHAELNAVHGRTCVVDSEHLAIHMAEGKPFNDIQGYGAISWVDDSDVTAVRLCRMRGGSLAVYGVTIGTRKDAPQVGVVWSSDERHAQAALRAAGLNGFAYEQPAEGQVYEVRGGKLWLTDERVVISAPAFVDKRVYALTNGVKDAGRGWCSVVQAAAVEDPTVAQRVAEIVNSDRPASWAQRRMELAKDLSLTQINASVWADDKGERVTAEDLDEIMESEFSATTMN